MAAMRTMSLVMRGLEHSVPLLTFWAGYHTGAFSGFSLESPNVIPGLHPDHAREILDVILAKPWGPRAVTIAQTFQVALFRVGEVAEAVRAALARVGFTDGVARIGSAAARALTGAASAVGIDPRPALSAVEQASALVLLPPVGATLAVSAQLQGFRVGIEASRMLVKLGVVIASNVGWWWMIGTTAERGARLIIHLLLGEVIRPAQERRGQRRVQTQYRVPWPTALKVPRELEDVEVPENLRCPISWDVMSEPAITMYGGTYNKKEIMQWARQNGTDPRTNLPLRPELIFPNLFARSCVEDWIEDQMAKIKEDG